MTKTVAREVSLPRNDKMVFGKAVRINGERMLKNRMNRTNHMMAAMITRISFSFRPKCPNHSFATIIQQVPSTLHVHICTLSDSPWESIAAIDCLRRDAKNVPYCSSP
jgi:hypothetical protein